MKSLTWLDLRLMFGRQPALAALLGIIVALSGVLLAHPPQTQEANLSLAVDPVRIIAAQRSFRGTLIAPAALAGAQQAVLELAATYRLTVGPVDYAQEVDSAGNFKTASMRLPVSGSYADIRHFVDAALSAQPAMSIRHLSLQREATDGTVALSATLSVQFLVGEAIR
ncbi:MAG: hypothetical protein D3M94_00400 [Rhodocyclales bacterium GT-UBC]|nr:MAG: hypothetical protein D3M94_00400 [Rhodocyclales bacterium GT-UBC]